MMQNHKPGSLKQTNKSHKVGRHKSKGSILKNFKGRVAEIPNSKKTKGLYNRLERKNHFIQMRKNKRDEILNKKRSIGRINGVPHIISIVPLSQDTSCLDILDIFMKCDPESNTSVSCNGIYTLNSVRLKSQFNFILPNQNDENTLLNITKISDTCLFLISPENCIDNIGNLLIEQIYSSHLPTSLILVKGLIEHKKKNQLKNDYQKIIESKFPEARLYNIDNINDGLTILHKISQHKLNESTYCKIRPHMLIDNVEFSSDCNEENYGTLKICGFLRGRNLNINNLVHLPALGTYKIKRIDILKTEITNQDGKLHKQENWKCIAISNSDNICTLVTQQTQQIDTNFKSNNNNENEISKSINCLVKKKVPKGTSEYQAAWIFESDNEDDSQSDNNEIQDEEIISSHEDNEIDSVETSHDEFEQDSQSAVHSFNEKDSEKMILDDESSMKNGNEIDVKFPDEVDTPQNIPARDRFKNYRGLKSFRSSHWDPQENLPETYGKIFKFDNFKKTLKNILKDEPDGAEPGWYIKIYLENVPIQKTNFFPTTMFGLLNHENKISIINILLKRNLSSYNATIKSKERLIFQIGARQFSACPIFSQHTNGDKHKFERFMPVNDSFVASIIAPITYFPASVLVYKELENGSNILVASGSILSIDPDRVIIKRIILTGHPYKVQKRNAVVRYMFFNPDDVNWFKPVELRTKMGKIGHIIEPLGTHGHMKCLFNDSIKCQDIIMMYLYKRIFPKWTYEENYNRIFKYPEQNEH